MARKKKVSCETSGKRKVSYGTCRMCGKPVVYLKSMYCSYECEMNGMRMDREESRSDGSQATQQA